MGVLVLLNEMGVLINGGLGFVNEMVLIFV